MLLGGWLLAPGGGKGAGGMKRVASPVSGAEPHACMRFARAAAAAAAVPAGRCLIRRHCFLCPPAMQHGDEVLDEAYVSSFGAPLLLLLLL